LFINAHLVFTGARAFAAATVFSALLALTLRYTYIGAQLLLQVRRVAYRDLQVEALWLGSAHESERVKEGERSGARGQVHGLGNFAVKPQLRRFVLGHLAYSKQHLYLDALSVCIEVVDAPEVQLAFRGAYCAAFRDQADAERGHITGGEIARQIRVIFAAVRVVGLAQPILVAGVAFRTLSAHSSAPIFAAFLTLAVRQAGAKSILAFILRPGTLSTHSSASIVAAVLVFAFRFTWRAGDNSKHARSRNRTGDQFSRWNCGCGFEKSPLSVVDPRQAEVVVFAQARSFRLG